MGRPDRRALNCARERFGVRRAGIHRAMKTEPGLASLTAHEDGPLLVRGAFLLVGEDGAVLEPGRRTVALCRCGQPGIKPFCDGNHNRTRLRSAPLVPRQPDSRRT
jgi:CDGSH-type Zn-finger protein